MSDAALPSRNTQQFKYTFPPFPVPPKDKKIQPFKEYKERGIRFDPGPDDAEVDGWGIRTVPFKKQHDDDVCKTNTKRKRAAEEAKKRGNSNVVQKTWWERWDEAEFNRFAPSVDPISPPTERLRSACADFTNQRTWPIHFAAETGPKYIWDKFLRFIGLPEGIPGPKGKMKGASKIAPQISDDEADDGDEPGPQVAEATGIVSESQLPEVLANELKSQQNERKLSGFVMDPETYIKVFLSSHARFEGYVWSEPNLDCLPRVLLYFFNFLIRAKVVSDLDRDFKRCINIIEESLVELPKTSSISKGYPSQFDKACKSLWGDKAESYFTFESGMEFDTPIPPESNDDKPEAKARLEEILLPTTSAADKDVETSNGGGAGESGWQTAGDWGTPLEFDSGWGGQENNEVTNPWMVAVDPVVTFMADIGPTAVPLTHTAGVAERSARRIKSITDPSPNPPPLPPLEEGAGPSADAVESVLDQLCSRVILTPLLDWDGGDADRYTRPTIISSSQVPIVDSNASPLASETSPPSQAAKPHDPLQDEITLLVKRDDPSLQHLKAGMILGGTFVQIARRDLGEASAPKKKKKGKSKRAPNNFWYIEDLTFVIPSFWTVRSAALPGPEVV